MPLMEVSDATEETVADVAIALAIATGLAWLVLVAPDPEPLVSLPAAFGVQPAIWLTVVLFLASYPLVRWFRST